MTERKFRLFRITDREAEEGNGPTTVELYVGRVEVPVGNEDAYDIRAVLHDLVDASGFDMSVEEVSDSTLATPDDFYQGGQPSK